MLTLEPTEDKFKTTF